MATVELVLEREADPLYGVVFRLYLGAHHQYLARFEVIPRVDKFTGFRYPKNRAVDVVCYFPGLNFSGKCKSIEDTREILSRLGLDPQPILEAAKELGWEC